VIAGASQHELTIFSNITAQGPSDWGNTASAADGLDIFLKKGFSFFNPLFGFFGYSITPHSSRDIFSS